MNVRGRRIDGVCAALELLLVAIHDHRMRFVGHHCLVADRSREKALEQQIEELTRKTRLKPARVR